MADPLNCALSVVSPEEVTHEGCTVRTKQRHVIVDQGQCSVIEWPLRDRNGNAADLSSCFPDDVSMSTSTSDSASASTSMSVAEDGMSIQVRFGDPCTDAIVNGCVTGTVTDAENGIVRFQLPSEICQNAGLYRFQIGVLNENSLMFSDKGLLSVEPGLFGNINNRRGPLTIREIRMHLRDTSTENDLLQDVEFDDDEIVDAIRRPIQQWNETPPPIQPIMTCRNFPYRYYWLQAVVGELLRTAAHHYVRNKQQTNAGGLNADDKAKDRDYMSLSSLYRDEWRHFLAMKKVALNAQNAWGRIG